MKVWSLFYILLLCVLFIICSVGTGLRPFLPSVTSSWCLEAAAHSTTAASHPPGKLLPTYCWPKRFSPRRYSPRRSSTGRTLPRRPWPKRCWTRTWRPRGRRICAGTTWSSVGLLLRASLSSSSSSSFAWSSGFPPIDGGGILTSDQNVGSQFYYQFSKSILCHNLERLPCSEDEWGVFFTNPRYTKNLDHIFGTYTYEKQILPKSIQKIIFFWDFNWGKWDFIPTWFLCRSLSYSYIFSGCSCSSWPHQSLRSHPCWKETIRWTFCRHQGTFPGFWKTSPS